MMENWQEAQQALRRVAKAPGFATTATLTVALGVGAATTIFAVVDNVILEPLPFEESRDLISVWHAAPGLDLEEVTISAAMCVIYRSENRVFEEMGFWSRGRVAVTQVADAEQVSSLNVSAGLFPVLRVPPFLGRAFREEDDLADAPPTVMLGHDYWIRRLGRDPTVVGSTLRVDGVVREIIGVVPVLPPLEADVYLPHGWNPESLPAAWSYRAVGRLAPGIAMEQVEADAARIIPLMPGRLSGGFTQAVLDLSQLRPSMRPLKDDFVGDGGSLIWLLFATGGFVLVIACANVANLFLVRADVRQRELAVRAALGATRTGIARQLLLESMSLALVGGVVGVALAHGGVRLLVLLEPDGVPRLNEIAVDLPVVGFALAASLLAGVLFALLPIIRIGVHGTAAVLSDGGRTASAGRQVHRARNALIVAWHR
jgi:predicted permease